MQELSLPSNGLTFHALAAGPEAGPLVVLLHGFPELSVSWTHQLEALGKAGYRAVAPDLRGYGGTDAKGPYDLQTLSADVAGLIKALGRERAVVVGHDWGGGVAWGTAFWEPQVVERLVVMNCPHPCVLVDDAVRNPVQVARSWYMFFFQIPFVPEWLMSRNRAGNVVGALKGGSTVRTHWTREALEPYREAFKDRARAAAAIGYYRAGFRTTGVNKKRALAHRIAAKTLILWGTQDRFLGTELLDPKKMAPYFTDTNTPEIRLIRESGHFVQNEAPEAVSAALLDWLGPPKT